MKITVLISVYNHQDFIKECIDSMLQQDYKNFELIVVNDGSTDKTLEILKTYDDDRMSIINLPTNCGVGTAKNIGLSIAKGKYIAIMDSDDIAFPNRLSTQINFLENNTHIDILGSRGILIDENKNVISSTNQPKLDKDIKARLLLMNGTAILHPTMMIRTEFIRKNHLFYENRKKSEDHVFWNKCILNGAIFHNIQTELIYKRRHTGSTTVSLDKNIWNYDKKNPIRFELLSMFYPNLMVREIMDISKLFSNRKLNLMDVVNGISSIEKALLDNKSYFGESKEYINKILQNTVNEFINKIKL